VSATRRQVLLFGGAAASLALARDGAAAAAPSNVELIERLLVLEHRLADAYERALARDAIDAALGETLLDHEREHVRALEQVLRGMGRREPRATVPGPVDGTAFASRDAFARFALGLETDTVAAYRETLSVLAADRLLQPLGSIMASGAQHQVALRNASGANLLGA
jgi:Ferritin-like domain